MKKQLSIKSKIHNYRVFFNDDIKKTINSYSNDTVFIIDKFVYSKFLKKIICNKKFLCIKSEEKNKDFTNLHKVINFFIKNVSRDTLVVSIGGGVIQDISSFLASIFKRGIEWNFIPTTIISQGDSCIGGKTSINFNKIKNQLGNFYPPKKIIINSNFVKNLPEKEFFSGLGEMGHYFLLSNLRDYKYYKNFLNSCSKKNNLNLNQMICRSLSIKKRYIENG